MNILFLDSYYEPETTAFTHLERDLINELVEKGNNVFIVCPTPSRGMAKEDIKRYRNILVEKTHDGRVFVRRFKAPRELKNPVIRAFRYFWCNFRTYTISKKMKNVDIIFCNSTPPTQGYIAALIKKKINKPLVYNVQDIFPDSLVNNGLTRAGSLVWKIGRKIEKTTYKSVDRIITISNRFKDNLVAKGVKPSLIDVVPNWNSGSDVHPVDRMNNKLFDKYNLDRNLFYVCYCGNFGHSQDLDLVLDVASGIDDLEIGFVLVGDGANKEKLQRRIVEEKINNVHLLPFQPYEDIASVFSLGNVGLIVSKKGVGGSSIPSKTWSIMAAEKPIIASFDNDSELCELINAIGCGFCVTPGDKVALSEAIKKLKTDHNNSMGQQGRKYVLDTLDKSICVPLFIDSLLGVANK